MMLFSALIFVLFLRLDFSNAKHSNLRSRSSYIDLLIDELQNEKWDKDELQCFNQLQSTLLNAKNLTLWATWVLDSIQFPSGVLYGSQYQLGNYDECLNPPWLLQYPQLRTKYCLVDVKLSDLALKKTEDFDPYASALSYIKTKSKHARTLGTITWGVCVPQLCRQKSIGAFLGSLFRISSLGIIEDVQISIDDCHVSENVEEYGYGYYVFWYLLLLLLVICVLSTWHLAISNRPQDSMKTRLAKCFCLNANSYDLVKPGSDEVPVLHGMRAMSAIICAFTHHIFFLNSGPIVNGLDVDEYIDMGSFVIHTDLMTDTFMMMSGLLLAKGLFGKQHLENPLLALWKRYIRLIAPIALVVLYMASVSAQCGGGPLWRLAKIEQDTCRENWWLALLMINNYINQENMCFIILWYVQADFQLTIFGTALIYLCRFNRRVGMTAVIASAILAVVLPAWTTYHEKLPATILYNIETMIDIRKNREFVTTYIRSHYRIGTYLIGMAMGYLFIVYKPSSHRNLISKKLSIILFITAFAIAWIPMSMSGVFYTRPYNVVEATLYAATNRLVWTLAIAALVIICEYGEMPIVNSLLSWSVWVPLSRLSYGLYLSHVTVVFYNVYSARAPLTVKPFTMLSDSFGPIVIGYTISYVVWLLVQAPVINLTNIIYGKKKTSEPKSMGDSQKSVLNENSFLETEKRKTQ